MSTLARAIEALTLEEQIKTGASHRIRIAYTELTDTAGTGKTFQVFPYIARDLIKDAWFDLVNPFVGTSITNLVFKFGWNGASVDDDDGLIASTEIASAGTEILAGRGRVDAGTVDGTYGAAEAAVINSHRALFEGLQAQEAGNLEVVFTSTGANLSALTAGVLYIYFKAIRPTDSALRPLSAP